MEQNHNNSKPENRKNNSGQIIAIVLILAGILLLGRNLSFIPPDLSRFLLSWPMLCIYIGVVALVKQKHSLGIILTATGVFFLLPRISYFGHGWYKDCWPVFLIAGGVLILFNLMKPSKIWSHYSESGKEAFGNINVENGFVSSDFRFKSGRCIVQEPVFRGARLDLSFGTISLDLRHTRLEAPVTYIDIAESFSGIELFIPSSWKIILETTASFGGVEDKRSVPYEIDYEHKLIIRGKISFGGLEIKN